MELPGSNAAAIGLGSDAVRATAVVAEGGRVETARSGDAVGGLLDDTAVVGQWSTAMVAEERPPPVLGLRGEGGLLARSVM
ncbi:hypothetical protein E2562_010503 [Oryza meyeriana var. granulata]|uniref:Uncharacterized protein n=1 Tax=Oryza meyeriana var. granulata TaxID=110450 RepID=A0A6G1DW82_9ORYZ|nr:hypothetical protein E2562_010503 [Oryza meyeriana var. granulata]